MFEKSSRYVTRESALLIDGDGVLLLPELARSVSTDSTLCIFHTHVANQMPPEKRNQLLEIVDTIGKEREVFHIYNNVHDLYLHLDYV